jgi:hypothetical protein
MALADVKKVIDDDDIRRLADQAREGRDTAIAERHTA